jgi:tellurite resistance-related uncharacterized protein
MVVILKLEVVPNMLVQSLSLKLAFWAQLVILESPIKILQKPEQKHASYFGELYSQVWFYF